MTATPLRTSTLFVLLLAACATPDDSGKDSASSDADSDADTSDTADTGSDTSDTGDDTDTDTETGDTETGDTGSDTSDTSDTSTSDSGDTADSGDTDPPCRVRSVGSTPADGASDHYYLDSIEFELSRPDPTAWVDAPFAGATTLVDEVVRYEPAAALAPNTSYTVTLHYCAGTDSITFTTSDYGTAVTDPEGLVGRTWALDIGSADWVEPSAFGALMGGYIERQLLMEVMDVDGATLDLRFGTSVDLSTPAEQDTTMVTYDWSGADFSGEPYFVATSSSIAVAATDVSLEVSDVTLEGTFASDGASIGGMALAGLLDTRPLVPLVDPSGADDTICNLLSALGATCEACADGTMYCLQVVVEDIPATEVADLELEEVSTGTSAACSVVSAGLPMGLVGVALVARRMGRRRR